MPIKLPELLPARAILERENIFVMNDQRAFSQDIRPMNIVILNLMPEKEKTEAQLLRLLGNSPLQVQITFLRTVTYESKNVSRSHLEDFYTDFESIRDRKFDGMIITGAPIEHFQFEEVAYWEEIVEIMNWAEKHVTSTLHICWGAQAALYHFFGVEKIALDKKCFGVFEHDLYNGKANIELLRGFDDLFFAPHSRHTTISMEQVNKHPDLELLGYSKEAGPFLLMSKDGKHIMATGHLEYDKHTLKQEYDRDCSKGIEINIPKNYFPNDDPTEQPKNIWRSHAHLLFSNWLNYYVYQQTPYEWK